MATRPTITLPLALCRVMCPEPDLTSRRTDKDLELILEGIDSIWGQADIQFSQESIGPRRRRLCPTWNELQPYWKICLGCGCTHW